MNRRDAFRTLLGVPIATAITRIPAADVKPTDVIVIEIPGKISADAAQRVQHSVKQLWPDHKVVVLGDGMKLRVLESVRVVEGA